MNNILLFGQRGTRAKQKKTEIFRLYKYLKLRLLGRMNVPTQDKMFATRITFVQMAERSWCGHRRSDQPQYNGTVCVRGTIINLKYFKRRILDTLRANEFIKTD